MNYKIIIGAFLTLYSVTFLLGFIWSYALGILPVILLEILTISLTVFTFFSVSNFVHKKKIIHLSCVLALLWLSEIPNIIFLEASFQNWIFNGFSMLIYMLAGIGLSTIVQKKQQ